MYYYVCLHMQNDKILHVFFPNFFFQGSIVLSIVKNSRKPNIGECLLKQQNNHGIGMFMKL